MNHAIAWHADGDRFLILQNAPADVYKRQPMLCSIPGLIYLAPTTCEEYFAMLRWSILQDKKPIAIRVPSNGVVRCV